MGGSADLERQVIDTRNQMIKTANAVSNLAGEVKEVSRQLAQQGRGRAAASVASYLVIVAVVGAGFFFVYRSRLEHVENEKEALAREHAIAKRKLADLSKKATQRRDAETKALAFYGLLRQGRAAEAIKRYPAIARLPLSKVETQLFRRWVDRNQDRLAYKAYAAGMRAVGEKQFKRAAQDFRRSLRMDKTPAYAASLWYYLGVAQMKLGSYQDAARALEKAIENKAHKLVSRELRFYLAGVYEQLDRRTQAVRTYKEYIKAQPGTRLAKVARRRIKALTK